MNCRPTWSLVVAFVVLSLLVLGALTAAAEDWPGFRGPRFDGAEVGVGRLTGQSEVGLALDWKTPIGPGYSGVAVVGDRVVTAFQAGENDVVAAFEAAGGRELWRASLAPAYRGHDGSHDGPIATPLVLADTVIAMGPRGQLVGFALSDGKERWRLDLPAEWKAEAPFYGFSSSPIAAAGLVILTVGAPEGRMVVALEPTTGKVRWSHGGDRVHYQSPALFEWGGHTVLLAVGRQHLLGLEPATGQLLWSHAHGGDEADIGGAKAVPVPAGTGKVLLSHTVNEAVLLEIGAGSDGSATVKELWKSRALANSYVVPVYHQGFFYGYSGRILSCVDAATGETRWRSRLPGDGFVTFVDGHLVILTKAGSLHLAKASPESYQEVAGVALFSGQAWTAPSFAHGKLWLRGMGELAAVSFTSQATRSVATPGTPLPGSRLERFLASLAAAGDKSQAIDTFLASLGNLPLVEEPDRVSFLYRGPATDVGLVSDFIGNRLEMPMQRVPGTDFFHFSTRLDPEIALSYRFVVDYGRPIPDPRNSHRRAGSGGTEHSWLALPGYIGQKVPPDSAARPGRVESFEIESALLPGKQPLSVWLPPGYEGGSQRYPVAYVHNGKDARELGEIPQLLDHRVGVSVRPLIVVFVDPVPPTTPPTPEPEGDPLELYARALAEEIVPEIDRRYLTLAAPEQRASLGAGIGSLLALHAALRAPAPFGKLGLQSLMLFTETEEELEKVLAQAVSARRRLEVTMEWSRYELRSEREAWNMGPVNERWARRFEAAGHHVKTRVVPLGWDWPSWKERFETVLAALFPLSPPTEDSP